MPDRSFAGARTTEWARLNRLALILFNLYVVVAIVVIIAQSTSRNRSGATSPARDAGAHPAYDLGLETNARHQADRRFKVTFYTVDFVAGQRCPADLRGAARDAWIAEFKAGYFHRAVPSVPEVALASGLPTVIVGSK